MTSLGKHTECVWFSFHLEEKKKKIRENENVFVEPIEMNACMEFEKKEEKISYDKIWMLIKLY